MLFASRAGSLYPVGHVGTHPQGPTRSAMPVRSQNSRTAVSTVAPDAVAVRRAIRSGQIIPWYQPIVDLSTGSTRGVEALARWPQPDRVVPPAEFIPLAEAGDLVIELDQAVIRHALTDLRRWQRTRPGFELSVNLSGRHLDSPAGVTDLVAIVEAAGVTPGTVCVELTETTRPDAADRGAPTLEALRSAGMSVWLDDFGAGFYNLRDLIRLSVDGIKLDRSFTAQLDLPRTAPLLRGLVAAVHEIGLKVTLEGIETPAEADWARRLACDLGQGFLWSAPRPAESVDGWLSGSPW